VIFRDLNIFLGISLGLFFGFELYLGFLEIFKDFD